MCLRLAHDGGLFLFMPEYYSTVWLTVFGRTSRLFTHRVMNTRDVSTFCYCEERSCERSYAMSPCF